MQLTWAEPNRARWVGIRPGHGGEQVAVSAAATDNQTTIVYTVPASERFFLTDWTLAMYAKASEWNYFYVRDESDVTLYHILRRYYTAASQGEVAHTHFVPLEIPAGYDLVVENSGTGCYTYVFIHGWVQAEGV